MDIIKDDMSNYLGYIVFYTQEGFWAGKSPNLNVAPSKEFCQSLGEIFFEEINEHFQFFVFKDGMIKF